MASPSGELGSTAVLVIPAQSRRAESGTERPAAAEAPRPTSPPTVESGPAPDIPRRAEQAEELAGSALTALGLEVPSPALGGRLPAEVQVAVLVAATELDDRGFADPSVAARAAVAAAEAVFGDPETARLAATAAAYATAALAAAEAFSARAARPRERPQPSAGVAAAAATAARTKAAARALAVGSLDAASREIAQLTAPPASETLAPVVSARSLPRLCAALQDLDADLRRQWHGAVAEPVLPWVVPEDDAEESSAAGRFPGPGEGGLMRDLTIARRIEGVLRAEDGELQEAFDHSPVALMICPVVAGVPVVRSVRRSNRALSALTGYTEAELRAGDVGVLLRPRPTPPSETADVDVVGEGLQRWTRADGSDMLVRVRMRLVERGPGSERFAVCSVDEVASSPGRRQRRRMRLAAGEPSDGLG